MTDLSKLVDTEHLYALHLHYPGNDAVMIPLTMQVRSSGSARVREINLRHGTERINKRVKGKNLDAGKLEREEYERVAACIASWEWGKDKDGNQFDWKGSVPELTMAKAIEVLSEAEWIYEQVKEAADNVANFTKTPHDT